MENKEINTLEDIDMSTPEGKLLVVALAALTSKVYTDRTADQVILSLKIIWKATHRISQSLTEETTS